MIKVSKIALVGALKKVVSFIPKIKTSDYSGVVSILPLDGKIKLILSYPEATIESICDAISSTPDEPKISIQGRKVLPMVAASDKEVELSITEEGFLEVVSGRSKWREPMPRVSTKPIVLPDKSDATFDVYPVLTAFNTVQYAVDSDSVRPSLYQIDVIDGRVRACNGFQYHEVQTKIAGLNFSIPGGMTESFIAVLRHFDGEVEFYTDDESFYFKNGPDVIAVRRQQLSFPDLDRLLVRPLRSEVPALLQVDRNKLLKSLRKAQLALDDHYPYVELHITKKEVLVRGTQKMGSEHSSVIPAVWDTRDRVATFNIKHIIQTIESLHTGTLELRFGPDTKKRKSPMAVEGVGTWTMVNQANLTAR